MAEKSGIKGFFKYLFGSEEEDEQEENVTEDNRQGNGKATAEEEAAKQETRPAFMHHDVSLPPLRPDMVSIWRMWSGNEVYPILSLTNGLDWEQHPLDSKALEREAVRLVVQLEKDAKLRLRDISKMEESKITKLDAKCKVYVARDRMIAWLFIFPPVGEDGTLQMESIGKSLQEMNVVSGIDTEAVVRCFQNKPYFQLIPIAVGTPAVQGKDGEVKELFARKLELQVAVDEKGRADYKHTNYVRQIHAGDVICDISLPVPGTAGVRIDGSVIEPKPVRAAKVPKGVNTTITEDGLHLVATMDGNLDFNNQMFQVRPVLTVTGDVDYETGNIRFTGDVHITGDVRENFSVFATGAVTIDGLVEAASVEAGGDLLISRGVVGDNRAMLRSKGCVRVKYLENCVVYAGKGVYADCIMNSQIFSDGCIDVYTGRGSVIGGAVTAAEVIRARMLGAESGRRTEVTLGMRPFVEAELQNLQNDLASIRTERESLDHQLRILERQQGMQGSDARLAKARMRRSVLEMKEQQVSKRLSDLNPMMADVSRCRLECDVIYPITVVTIQDAVWKAKEVKRRCKVVYDVDEGLIKEVY